MIAPEPSRPGLRPRSSHPRRGPDSCPAPVAFSSLGRPALPPVPASVRPTPPRSPIRRACRAPGGSPAADSTRCGLLPAAGTTAQSSARKAAAGR
ncbi:MAG: hypothetical protein AVDCRST_MAG49-1775 [uncultured Thermomicrobiales bacterium]|uniref:Uncharacterized protein n=1 Tax=uncultured Thermomicrobiales bacterium TaxID=1645740 RepID=A0A6J4UHB9_9BACT|nr:MAG: hypothetical protein AVDCRST_MAG49-1775 [uncultured Thermomicrobiales bacterium]